MADTQKPERSAVHQALLRRAGIRSLTNSSTSELHSMNRELASACETARRAAIERILYPGPDYGKDHPTDANFGFAGLFAGLRRVRAELDRRKSKAFSENAVDARQARTDHAKAPDRGAALSLAARGAHGGLSGIGCRRKADA